MPSTLPAWGGRAPARQVSQVTAATLVAHACSWLMSDAELFTQLRSAPGMRHHVCSDPPALSESRDKVSGLGWWGQVAPKDIGFSSFLPAKLAEKKNNHGFVGRQPLR